MSDQNAILSAALDYAGRGWRVIELHRVGPDGKTCSCNKGARCPSAGKHPKDRKWEQTPALSSPDIFAIWDVERAPNLGIATGSPSGFWVLDIDTDHKDGAASMRAFVEQHGPLPKTYVTQTGGGGYHYFFNLPTDFTVRNDQSGWVAPGIDVRGEGGQIVAPPSISDKGAYTVIQDAPVADAPAWLLEAVKKPEHADIEVVTAEDLPKPADIEPAEWDRLNRYTQRVLESELGRLKQLSVTGWDGEPWDHTTFEVACNLIEVASYRTPD